MRSSPAISLIEAHGYSECLDRLSARARQRRPLATYRLQFHAGFRFVDALRIVPYLEQLGVSHCYSSPILKARPGSMHGYDITDHNQLNPEIGSQEEFQAFASELKQRGMGLILDVVPNHVGISENNPWWHDVLENGRASAYADYFDIDWQPLKAELLNKLLLPILGEQYGEELEQGRLSLVFDEETSEFLLAYYDRRLPLDPRSLPLIFSPTPAYTTPLRGIRPDAVADEPEVLAFRALLTEFSNLPPHFTTDRDQVAERQRQMPPLKQRLQALVRESAAVRQFVREAVRHVNGTPGDARSFDMLHRILEVQVYRLAHWRVSAEEINYRRFFDINDLVGLRMENPAVFAATHRLIRSFLAEGTVAGLRIDHPDGLYNPRQYFTRLQMLYGASQCSGPEPRPPLAENGIEAEFQKIFGEQDWVSRKPPLYLLAEKILQPGEELPAEWTVDGTVGYEFVNLVNGIFIERRNERAFTTLYHRFVGDSTSVDEIIYQSKKLIMESALPSEVNVLTHMLEEISSIERHARDFTRNSLRHAIQEIIAWFPVYRTYIDERGNVTERDRQYISAASARAKRRNQGTPAAIFDFVRDTLLLKQESVTALPDSHLKRLQFTLKFQQLTGPVMAKGLEDTTCYVYNRFASLNEVGGTPKQFGVSMEEFHAANLKRAEQWPHSLLATSTHDTKRSQDVRARLNVLSEMPKQWSEAVRRWRRANRARKKLLSDGRSVPDANEEYLLYQTLIGAVPWPADLKNDSARAEFTRRVQQYMNKAVHEAKRNLSWINTNPEYIAALEQFIERILAPSGRRNMNQFWEDFAGFYPAVAYFGVFNSLAQALIKITAPGVPDIYQGNEVWNFSLVDPDNRRPVDFKLRHKLLQQLLRRANSGDLVSLCRELLRKYEDGRVKMWVTMRALGVRREHAALLQSGAYISLRATGSKAGHVVAFARVLQDDMVVTVVPRLSYTLSKGHEHAPIGELWGDTELVLPRNAPDFFANAFTGQVSATSAARTLLCREIFSDFPVALLSGR